MYSSIAQRSPETNLSSISALQTKRQQLRFCQRTTDTEKLSFLLVGTSEFCKLMQESVFSLYKKIHNTEATVSVTESVESILQSTKKLHIDFIVFLMDTVQRQSIEQVERDICLLDPIYLCDKTILIDGCSDLVPSCLGVSYDDLFSITRKYHLHLIHGNIKDENSRTNMAKRIVTFATTACGLKSGIPSILHFSTDKFSIY